MYIYMYIHIHIKQIETNTYMYIYVYIYSSKPFICMCLFKPFISCYIFITLDCSSL